MSMEISTTRQRREISLTRLEQYRELWLYLFILILIGLLVFAGFKIVFLQGPQLYRSEDEMIAGGKRFVDYFYSLNSATVDHDQLRALNMIVDEDIRFRQFEILKKDDLIRSTKKAQMTSRIDWTQAEVEVLERFRDGRMDIRYQAHLVRNDQSAATLEIVLNLIPIEKNDSNTDGVGVLGWTDVAEHPFD